MSEDILMCLESASQANSKAAQSLKQQVILEYRPLTPMPNKSLNEHIDRIKTVKNLLDSRKDIHDVIKFLKELPRTDVVHKARVAKNVKAFLKLPIADLILAGVDTSLGRWLIDNYNLLPDAVKKMSQEEFKTRFLQELNSKYGHMSFKEYFTQVTLKEASDGLTMFGKTFAEILDNLTGNSVSNMAKVFKGGDPISDMEKSIDDLLGPLVRPLIHSIKNRK
jgi:hypothetical protein